MRAWPRWVISGDDPGSVPLTDGNPKGTSKKYQCTLNRDKGWEALGEAGFERVRQVAIDEDWTAIRFRRVEFIKTMTRRESFALTKQGKAKTRK